MTARRSSIGDELASARLDLVQRMEEARQTVEAVLSGLGERVAGLPLGGRRRGVPAQVAALPPDAPAP